MIVVLQPPQLQSHKLINILFYTSLKFCILSPIILHCSVTNDKKKLKYDKKITINLFLIVMSMCFILGQPPPTPLPRTHSLTH